MKPVSSSLPANSSDAPFPNPLGYVNLHWLLEFLTRASREFDERHTDYAGDMFGIERYDFSQPGNLRLFLKDGVEPALSHYNSFQRSLIQSALACAVATADAALWARCGNTQQGWFDDVVLSDTPTETFRELYDLMSEESSAPGLSQYAYLTWTFDTTDSLDLYQFC